MPEDLSVWDGTATASGGVRGSSQKFCISGFDTGSGPTRCAEVALFSCLVGTGRLIVVLLGYVDVAARFARAGHQSSYPSP